MAERFTSLALLPNLAPRSPGWRRHAPAVLYLVALGALLVSLARPQAVIPVRKDESTVVMVMDTSISMVATDVQPNRLTAAQSAGRRFLETLPEAVRVGLISFSNAPEVQTLPTDDRQALRAALQGLQAGGGTAMGDALSQALDIAAAARAESAAAGRRRSRRPPPPRPPPPAPGRPPPPAPQAPGTAPQGAPAAVLLLSDGAQTAGTIEPLAAAQRARELGIPIYTIALGTQGGTIESPDAPGTGQRLAVPPDETTLRQVADAHRGALLHRPHGERPARRLRRPGGLSQRRARAARGDGPGRRDRRRPAHRRRGAGPGLVQPLPLTARFPKGTPIEAGAALALV